MSKTRIVMVIISILLSFSLIACSNEETDLKLIALEEAIGNLEEENTNRVGEIENVQKTIKESQDKVKSLETQLSSYEEVINNNLSLIEKIKQDLEDEVLESNTLKDKLQTLTNEQESLNQEKEELLKQINDLSETINNLVNKQSELLIKQSELEKQVESQEKTINVFLASKYYLVVGDTFQLFYRSIIQAPNPYGYYVKVIGSVGHMFNRYYEFKPDKIGTFSLTIEVCDENGKVYGSDSTKLVVSMATISESSNVKKNVLCIGDSLTSNGYWVSQGYKKYVASGYTNVNFIGTKSGGYSGTTVNYEGYVGWQWSTFFTGENSGTSFIDTPFRSTTNKSKISFIEYCEKNGYSGIDEVYILLTWNGIGCNQEFREFTFSDSLFSKAKLFIDQLHTEYPNAKISLLSIPLPSVNAGLGAYYTLNKSYADNYAQLVSAMNYDNFMEKWCEMEEYSSFMRYVDSKGQFDTEYNMPTVTKPVNTENSTTEKVGTSMGMHPTTSGYLQIGDAFYRALMKKW